MSFPNFVFWSFSTFPELFRDLFAMCCPILYFFCLFQALVTKVLNVLVDLCSKGFITHYSKVEKIFKLTTHRKSLAFFQRRGKEPLWPFVFSGKTIGLLAQLVPLVGNAKIECALELIYNFSRHNSLEKKFQVQRNFIPLIYWFVCCPSFSLHRALKTILKTSFDLFKLLTWAFWAFSDPFTY